MQKLLPSLGYGALVGGLVTAPLIGLMYLADKLLDLPFVPFAFFDWIARVTPGPADYLWHRHDDRVAVAVQP